MGSFGLKFIFDYELEAINRLFCLCMSSKPCCELQTCYCFVNPLVHCFLIF